MGAFLHTCAPVSLPRTKNELTIHFIVCSLGSSELFFGFLTFEKLLQLAGTFLYTRTTSTSFNATSFVNKLLDVSVC